MANTLSARTRSRRARIARSAWEPSLLPSVLDEGIDETPLLVTDCDVIAARVAAFSAALPSVQPFYAVKCNPSLSVLRTMRRAGVGFEIASIYELDTLRALDVDPVDVLFSNTVKPYRHIAAAAAAGVWRFALDSEPELRKIADAAPGSGVYVRVTVPDGQSLFPLSRKFGTSMDEAARLLLLAPSLGLRPYGVTFHVGSQCTNTDQFALALDQCGLLLRRLSRQGLIVEMLDVGGGMPAQYSEPVPSIGEIGGVIEAAIERLPYRPELIAAEPGRFLVAESSVLVSTVIGIAKRSGERWAYLDVGGFNGLMEAVQTGGRWRLPLQTNRADEDVARQALFTVTGPSCDSTDTMFYDVALPDTLETGDRIYIGSAGAYTLSYASSFNGFPPPRAVYIGSS